MRNLTVYLLLFLCLFVNKVVAQETYEQAYQKFEIKNKQINDEEEKIFNIEIEKLKKERRNGSISRKQFKEQEIVLKKKKNSNKMEKYRLVWEDFDKKFPEGNAKTFGEKSERISIGIYSDINKEKEALKKEIEAVDKQLVEGVITKSQAEEQKKKLAENRAGTIESKVSKRQEAYNNLIQDKIDGKLPQEYTYDTGRGLMLTVSGNNSNRPIGQSNNFAFPAMKAYNGQIDKDRQQNKRTSSQVVFAIGANNVVTDGGVSNSDFKYWDSRFYEWGFTFNSRIISKQNLLHAKYGLSLMYNDLQPTDNRFFVDKGNETVLETNPLTQECSRFRNVNLVVPLHLEFDFTKPTIKEGKTYFKSHNSFRIGLGGYLGANLKSKQTIKYDLDGYNTKVRTRGDFNTTDFIYGLSTYVSYKATGLYLKYDLNPLFKDNVVKQNNVSLGLRFDFN